LAGSLAQFAVQLPAVLTLLGSFSPWPRWALGSVRQVISGFFPAFAGRGVVQISGLIDLRYASMISERAVAVLTYTQTISLLPISLFGMAISAAELPEMSAEATGTVEERSRAITARLAAGLERMAFFVVPSAVAFMALGDVLAGVVFQSGKFGPLDSRFAWYLLLGSGVALSAQTSGRLYSSAFYALKDTRTPLKFATLRVGVGIVLGYFAVRVVPEMLDLPQHLGAVFITFTTGVTAWFEMLLLRAGLKKRLGPLPSSRLPLIKVWTAALVAALVTLVLKMGLGDAFGHVDVSAEWGGSVLAPVGLPTVPTSLGLLVAFCGCYGVTCLALGVPQAADITRRFIRRAR
jgi:putative peptidoglycan lipid II flippase